MAYNITWLKQGKVAAFFISGPKFLSPKMKKILNFRIFNAILSIAQCGIHEALLKLLHFGKEDKTVNSW